MEDPDGDNTSQVLTNEQRLYSPLPEGTYVRLLEVALGN
jgi:hypothetical protein